MFTAPGWARVCHAGHEPESDHIPMADRLPHGDMPGIQPLQNVLCIFPCRVHRSHGAAREGKHRGDSNNNAFFVVCFTHRRRKTRETCGKNQDYGLSHRLRLMSRVARIPMEVAGGNQTAAANATFSSTDKAEETTFAGSLLQWTGTGDWGIIASEYNRPPRPFSVLCPCRPHATAQKANPSCRPRGRAGGKGADWSRLAQPGGSRQPSWCKWRGTQDCGLGWPATEIAPTFLPGDMPSPLQRPRGQSRCAASERGSVTSA